MAVRAQKRLYSQARLTTSTWRSVESAVAFDFDTVLRNFCTGTTRGYILSGFSINIDSSSFSAIASNLTLDSLNATILHTLASESGTILHVDDGSTGEVLNSTNAKVIGGFASSSTNYVGIELVRVVDEESTEQTYFWDADAEAEFSRVLPASTILDYRIVINQTGFGNLLPIAVVVTDSSNIATSITDSRDLFFRLGTGGASPNPNYNYPWSAGRTEPGATTSSASVDPFTGADKQIDSLRSWIEAVETSIKEVKGTAFWFEPGTGSGGSSGGLSVFSVAEDANFSYLTGEGVITHNNATTGLLQWSNDLFIRNVFSSAYYKIQSNATGITMSNGSVLAVSLTRYALLSANVVFAPSLATVPAGVQTAASSVTRRIIAGNVGDFTVLTANSSTTDRGDFVKVFSDSSRYYTQLSEFYDTIGAVTSSSNAKYAVLTSAYNGSIGTQTLQYNKTYYPTSNLIVTSPENVLGQTSLGNLRWIASRNDLVSRSVIYLRDWGELQKGESRQISDNTSENVLQFIGAMTSGSTNESLTVPPYSATVSGAITSPTQVNYSGTSTDNLTDRVSKLSTAMANKAQDKNITLMGGGTVSNVAGLVTWNASATISVNGPGSGTVNWIPAGNANLAGSYVCGYVTIDRNVSTSLAVSVTSMANLPLAENTLVIARKLADNNVYVGVDGLSYLIGDNTDSSSGFNPASFGTFGLNTLHKWTQEIPSGTINSANVSFTIANSPVAVTAVVVFKNGLYQTQGTSVTHDYNFANQQLTFSNAPLTGDEIVCMYARGGTVPYSYVQASKVLTSITSVVALDTLMSNTSTVAVFLNGLQRGANVDYTASAASIGFAFSLTTTDKVSCFYTGVNDNLIGSQRYFRETVSNTRTIYTTFVDTGFSDNSLLMSIDGVQQFPINNTYGVTSGAISVIDYRRLNDQTFEVATSSLTVGSLLYLWSR